MSDDWQPGDKALCINDGGCGPFTTWCPQVGCIYTVAEAFLGDLPEGGEAIGLELEEDPTVFDGISAWYAANFRKIRPDAHEGEIEDWELLLDSMKRRVRA
jgi:hypothetical protein